MSMYWWVALMIALMLYGAIDLVVNLLRAVV